MSDDLKCKTCGIPMMLEGGQLLCPHCLLNLGLGDEEGMEKLGRGTDDAHAPSGISEPGTKLRNTADYELLEEIGRSGMGVVYKARQLSLNRLVALKMICRVGSPSQKTMQRFHLEARVAAKLEHPNIVTTYGSGELDGEPFICMRLIEGSDLGKQMQHLSLAFNAETKDRTLASRMVLRLAQERIALLIATIARAVHYFHQQGIIHRDLKPSNILLDAKGQPYVADFGIAKILTEQIKLTERTSILGTPDYMSPEQAAGKPASAASDIYSLGAILYELLTGRAPFHSQTLAETLRRITEEEAVAPRLVNRQVDKDLSIICRKCLDKEPLARYRSAEALAEDLENWLEHKPIAARRPNVLLRSRRWVRRNPVITILLGVLGIALAWALLSTVQKAGIIEGVRRTTKNDLENLWGQKVPSVKISAETRVLLMGGATRDAETRLTFAIYVHDETPIERLGSFAPVLNKLEGSVSKTLGRPVQIDFVIYRSYDLARNAVLEGNVDFARFGAASYVVAKKQDPRVFILAAQKHVNFNGVIFTQSTNTIKTLQQLKAKTLVWGHTNSTTGCQLGRFYLAEKGFKAKDFSNFATNYLKNHADVTNAIAQGKYDAGAAKESYVKANPAFHILGKYPNVGMVWVARPDFDVTLSNAITSNLLSMDRKLLQGIEDTVIGFELKEDKDYNPLRQKMALGDHFYDP